MNVLEEPEFDEALLDEMVTAIGSDFALAGQSSIVGYITDDRCSPTLLTMAVVRAHLLGAASMLAASTDGPDGLEAGAWLLEAFAEAYASVGSIARGAAQ